PWWSGRLHTGGSRRRGPVGGFLGDAGRPRRRLWHLGLVAAVGNCRGRGLLASIPAFAAAECLVEAFCDISRDLCSEFLVLVPGGDVAEDRGVVAEDDDGLAGVELPEPGGWGDVEFVMADGGGGPVAVGGGGGLAHAVAADLVGQVCQGLVVLDAG